MRSLDVLIWETPQPKIGEAQSYGLFYTENPTQKLLCSHNVLMKFILSRRSANITLASPEHSLNGSCTTFYQSISLKVLKIFFLPCKFSSCLGNFPLFATSFCFHLLLTFFIRKHFRYVRTILQTCVKFYLLFSDSRVFPRSLLYFTSINILPLLALGGTVQKSRSDGTRGELTSGI